ncbi:MAG: hypothetical protein ABF537_05765 [Acetobacter sp.]|uniref:hypothetical protein n=1 Tax=Acetobacter sp. TaxID=440 RepID=UPI0039E90916
MIKISKNIIESPFTTLFVALAISHIYIYVKKPSARFLKKIDYWWLGFTSLALFGAIDKQNQLFADGDIALSKSRLRASISELKREISFQNHYVCDTHWLAPPYSIPDPSSIVRYKTRDEACAWYKRLDESVSKAGLSDKEIIDISNHPIPEQISEWPDDNIKTAINEAKKELTFRDDTLSSYEKSILYKCVLLFSPYLLALALALRIAKVSGELRLDTAKKKTDNRQL